MTEPANYVTEYSTIVCLIIIVNIIFSEYFKYYFTNDHFFFTVRSPCHTALPDPMIIGKVIFEISRKNDVHNNYETDYSSTTILCPIISWHSHFPG